MSAALDVMPEVLSTRVDAGATVLELAIAAELLAFDGHYPGNPILPGVVQVDWAIRLAREAFGAATGRAYWDAFAGIEQLKFHQLIRPGERLALRLELKAAEGKLAFSYEGAEGRKSSGQIRFGHAA
ncbi:MAG TPA: hypothetical protein VGP15_01860 [Burkholderiales bacterium]|jgi:3-hydroxymyristoyl/3-hydroxydecanoyl-(acyl carrier protein) dehydratase|nr:hypothetical protein [Burkholderiales bacterium]